jgi:hypothetical protein
MIWFLGQNRSSIRNNVIPKWARLFNSKMAEVRTKGNAQRAIRNVSDVSSQARYQCSPKAIESEPNSTTRTPSNDTILIPAMLLSWIGRMALWCALLTADFAGCRLITNRRFIQTRRKKMRGGDAKDTGILTVGRRAKFIK